MSRGLNLYTTLFFEVTSLEKTKTIVKQILRYKKGIALLSVGRLLPQEWNYIVIEVKRKNDNYIDLRIRPLEVIDRCLTRDHMKKT